MKSATGIFLSLLHSVIPLVSAIDIHAYQNLGCSDTPYATCLDIAPNTCCIVIAGNAPDLFGAASGQWTGLTGSTGIQGYQTSRTGQTCGTVLEDQVVSGVSESCLGAPNSGQFAGLGWYTPTAALRMGKADAMASEVCTGQHWPDVIRVGGVEYCTTGAEKGLIGELLELALNTTGTRNAIGGFADLVCGQDP